MHIFLTGDRQIGKTTALLKAAALLGIPADGFLTYFAEGRNHPDRRLCMRRAMHEEAPEVVAAFHEGRKPRVLTERFDAFGSGLLLQARETAGLILMDELGRLERDALLFQRTVLETLDGGAPVLGVVRHDAGGWTERVKAHPKVRLLYVTPQNRDALPARIAALLAAEDG